VSTRDGEPQLDFLKKPVTRRQVLKGAGIVGAGAAFGPFVAACGGGESSSSASPSASAGTPKAGGTLRVAAGAGAAKENLDIHYPALTIPALDMRFNMYDSLLEFSSDFVLGMALAEEVEANADATQFTVRLKPGIVFHDGKPVTADDVVYSFNRILDPKNPGLAASQLIGLAPGGIKKVDDLTVRFELDSANAVFPQGLAGYAAGIVPDGYSPKGADGAIGTGPFMVESFLPGEKGVFAKNPDYWREGPFVDTLSIIEFADSTAQLNALLGGAADYCNMITGPQKKVAEGAGFKLLTAKTGSWIPFTMNVTEKPFDDPRVLQAFRLIVDRSQMIEQAVSGNAWVGNDMYAPFDPSYPSDQPQREQDLEQAKSLLKAAGYDNDLTIKLTTSTAASGEAPAAATVFAQQAKGAGVTVKVDNVTGDVFYGSEYLKWVFAQDNWGTRGYLMQAAFGSMPKAFYNETHWTNAKWLALVTEAFQTVDDAKRNELNREASIIEYNEGANIIPYFAIQTDAYSSKVQGAVADVSGLGSAACNARYRTMSLA
jgi:peptide/nickel transport system substrate-binding protein